MRKHAGLGIVAAIVLVLSGAVVYLAVSLAGVAPELDETTASLQRATQELSWQEATNAVLEQTNSTLRADKAKLEGYLDNAFEQNNVLATEKVGLQSDLIAAEDRYNRLDAAHAKLAAAHDALADEHDDLQGDHGDLAARHGDLTRQYQELESMAARASELQEQILALEAQLEPLVVSVHSKQREWFRCTGSMEPAITCLDSATWIAPADPADIVVGATISFDPNCFEGDVDGRRTAHRVAATKVVNGVTYYWPKGDANERADGCWVPYSNVHGYLVELHKGTHPENASLRDKVNASKAARDAAEATAEEAEATMRTAGAAYDALIAELCGEGVRTDSCQLSTEGNTRAVAAYARYLTAFERYGAAYAVYEAAYNRWNCWYSNAEQSESPGHIPHEC